MLIQVIHQLLDESKPAGTALFFKHTPISWGTSNNIIVAERLDGTQLGIFWVDKRSRLVWSYGMDSFVRYDLSDPHFDQNLWRAIDSQVGIEPPKPRPSLLERIIRLFAA